MRFIDRIDVVVVPGRGGDGVASFRREAHVPRGGPDGGDGGHGGAVVFRATTSRNTLQDYRTNKRYKAQDGLPGQGKQMTGRRGDDLVLFVPIGTVLTDLETGDVIADLDEEGVEHTFPGGRGGLGNVHFKSSKNRTPMRFIPGKEVDEVRVRLELKLIADVGLLGFPNAGKSTLISRLSAAKPKIADYPFTTLVPQLGVVSLDPGQSFVIADIPGLIEGAAEGAGLGHRFLRHVERCACLLHLVSAESWDDSVAERYIKLKDELAAYDPELAKRPVLPVLTKTDLVDEEERDRLLAELAEAAGKPALAISSVDGTNLRPLVGAVWRALVALGRVKEGD